MLVVIGFNQHTVEMQRIMANFPARVNTVADSYLDFPYTIDDVISRCVKVASIQDKQAREYESQFQLTELKHNLAIFDPQLSYEISNLCNLLVSDLVLFFTKNQWYDSDGSCPFRYNGYVGNFDIQLVKPDI